MFGWSWVCAELAARELSAREPSVSLMVALVGRGLCYCDSVPCDAADILT